MITPLFTFDERIVAGSDFTNAAWAKTNITVTPNFATAPDGTLTADKITATTTAVALMNQTINGVGRAQLNKSYICFLKQGTGATVGNTVIFRNGTTAVNLLVVSINLTTGAILSNSGSINTGVTVLTLANGWFAVVLTPTSGVSDGDNILCYVGFIGGAQTAGDFVLAWGASLSTTLFPTYPAIGKNMDNEYTARRSDSITTSGIKQSVWEATDIFKSLDFKFVPVLDISLWNTFMLWALQGLSFVYYPDSTQLSSGVSYTIEDTKYVPSRVAFNTGGIKFTMRQFV